MIALHFRIFVLGCILSLSPLIYLLLSGVNAVPNLEYILFNITNQTILCAFSFVVSSRLRLEKSILRFNIRLIQLVILISVLFLIVQNIDIMLNGVTARDDLINNTGGLKRFYGIFIIGVNTLVLISYLIEKNVKNILIHFFIICLSSLLFLSRSGLLDFMFFTLVIYPSLFFKSKRSIIFTTLFITVIFALSYLQGRSEVSGLFSTVYGAMSTVFRYHSFSYWLADSFNCGPSMEWLGGVLVIKLMESLGYSSIIPEIIITGENLSQHYGKWTPANVFYPFMIIAFKCSGLVGWLIALLVNFMVLCLPAILRRSELIPLVLFIVIIDSIFQHPYYRLLNFSLILIAILLFKPQKQNSIHAEI